DCCFPVRPFEEKLNALTLPGCRDGNVTLVPGRSEIMLRRLAEERHFDLAGAGIGFVIVSEEPVSVVKGEDPRRVGWDVVAVTLRLENAGELDLVWKRFRRPLFGKAGIGRVETEAPGAGKGKGGGCRGGDEKEEG